MVENLVGGERWVRTTVTGFANLCLTTRPSHRGSSYSCENFSFFFFYRKSALDFQASFCMSTIGSLFCTKSHSGFYRHVIDIVSGTSMLDSPHRYARILQMHLVEMEDYIFSLLAVYLHHEICCFVARRGIEPLLSVLETDLLTLTSPGRD